MSCVKNMCAVSVTDHITGEGSPTTRKRQDIRLFSLRGAHLIAMLVRTDIAKEFRVWLLDIIEGRGKSDDRRVATIKPLATLPTRQERKIRHWKLTLVRSYAELAALGVDVRAINQDGVIDYSEQISGGNTI